MAARKSGGSSSAAFYEALCQEEGWAIRRLLSRTATGVLPYARQISLTDEDIEELVCDSVTLLLLKIRQQQFIWQDVDPTVFAIGIARNNARHYVRRSQNTRRRLSEVEALCLEWQSCEDTGILSAACEMIETLLRRMTENCAQIIRLYYLEELSDKEVIDRKLTHYSRVDSLKNQRARCMKHLAELAFNSSSHDGAVPIK